MKFALRRSFFSQGLRNLQFSRSVSNGASSKVETPKGGTGIMFMNMGGPSTVGETRDFLYRLFSDGDLIPFGKFQSTIAKFITAVRTPKIEKYYEAIGGGSPIRKWSEYQASETCKILDKIHPSTAPHKPYVAFRYAKPLTEETLQKMKADGITRAVAFSQYPQYSWSTSGSSYNELYRQSTKIDPEKSIKWSFIDRWPTHTGFVKVVARHIQEKLDTITDSEARAKAVILFSAHSLPMEIVNLGDSYPGEVAATAYAVMEELKFSNRYMICWQSQVGPKPWLGPQTQKVVDNYQKKSDDYLVLVPIAFTSDHIETLHELDVELIGEAKKPEKLLRAESMNGDPEFIVALADIVKTHLEGNSLHSKQFEIECPFNDQFEPQKKIFSS